MLVSVRCPRSLSWTCSPTPSWCWCVGMWLLYDASKREVSTQPKLIVLPHAYLMLVWIAVLFQVVEWLCCWLWQVVGCSIFWWCWGRKMFEIQVCGHKAGCSVEYIPSWWSDVGGSWNVGYSMMILKCWRRCCSVGRSRCWSMVAVTVVTLACL